MRIESVWIENYRSIRSIRLDGLGPFVVLYGENGAGKSNILAAIQLLFDAMGEWARGNDNPDIPEDALPLPYAGDLRLGCEVSWKRGGAVRTLLRFEVAQDFLMSQVAATVNGEPPRDRDVVSYPANRLRFVPAVRQIETEATDRGGSQESGSRRISGLLASGRIKQAFVESLTNPDLEVRMGLRRLQDTLAGPPLYRPRFDCIHDPAKGRYELNEVREVDRRPVAIPVDLAGLGIQQIYHVMAGIFLVGARVVAVEEPEAHLHPRTSGLQLRQLLARCVNEGRVDQLFIATHSNLFDLDPEGYFYVRNDPERGTTAERHTDFSLLDREVFWEPGPARHALLDMLRYLPADTVVFRDPESGPIPAARMVELLQADDPVAVRFVNDVNTTAVRTVQRLAKRENKA